MARILLAEDEEVLRMLVVDTLEDEGYEIDEAEDGEQAVEKIKNQSYDLIILDYMMPMMTGLDVLKHLRSLPETKDTKVMILSAKSQQADIAQIKEAGADYYMSKPFSPLELVNKIGEILGA